MRIRLGKRKVRASEVSGSNHQRPVGLRVLPDTWPDRRSNGFTIVASLCTADRGCTLPARSLCAVGTGPRVDGLRMGVTSRRLDFGCIGGIAVRSLLPRRDTRAKFLGPCSPPAAAALFMWFNRCRGEYTMKDGGRMSAPAATAAALFSATRDRREKGAPGVPLRLRACCW